MYAVFEKLIRRGHLRIIDSHNKIRDFGEKGAKPSATVRLHDKFLFYKLPLNFSLYFGEAYMDGGITVEDGTIYDVIEVFAMNYHDMPPLPHKKLFSFILPMARFIQQHNPVGKAKQNVAHHYDLSDKLYRLFLDPDMQYSCAYYTDPNNSLEQAQLDKKRHLAAKLQLKPGMKVLDIGSGWGGLAIYLAKTFGVEVTGVTLSEEQIKIANRRVKDEGLEGKVKFFLKDYRELNESFDRIVSVGMFEHVGVHYYTEFFDKVKQLLTPTGIALIHSIGRMDGPGATAAWIRKYIFPGGYAPALSEVLPVIEKSGMWATDIEILRLHYAETLKAWRENFNKHRTEIAQIYDERFCRMWEFYLIGAEMDFRYMYMMNFQLQICKDIRAVPLQRDYIYETEHNSFQHHETLRKKSA